VAEGGAYAGETVELIRNIFAQAGQCVDVLLAPQMRIDMMERQGSLDGDAWRDAVYLDDNPALTKVPTPVQHFSVSLYWRKDAADPAATPGTVVGILAGKSWARDALHGMPVTLFEATSYRQLLHLVRTGRIQALVMPTLTFAKLAEEEKEDPSAFRSREVLSRPFYLALQKRNAGMIPALNEAIKTLWAKGVISDSPSAQQR
jgi:ABC-type amino acid transport substrate-binding protein